MHITGRVGYGPTRLIAVWLTKTLYGCRTWSQAVRLIADNPQLQSACGCRHPQDVPSEDAWYRFKRRLLADPDARVCFGLFLTSVQQALQEMCPDYGQDVAIDSTPIRGYANGQRYVRRGGPLRTHCADPDASWGHRGATSSMGHGGYYGYKVHACACTRYTWPISWETATGKSYEPKKVEPLLIQARAYGFRVQTAAMDKGYDYRLVYQVCQAMRVRPIIPLNKKGKARDLHGVPECRHGGWVFAGGDVTIAASKWRCPSGLCSPGSVWIKADRFHPVLPRSTAKFRRLYERRTTIERLFATMKQYGALDTVTVRRLERVSLHVDLHMTAQLVLVLTRGRPTNH